MDEFKPEDELKPDPSDRRTGRSRQSSERSERTERGEPQINFDDIELALEQIGKNRGCLIKGGIVDYDKVYALIINDIKKDVAYTFK